MANFQPLVSVIIPTYNQADLLVETIESVFAQTYPHFEVIIIDDGSTDHTAKVLAAYSDRLTVLNRKNGGTAAARNTGIAHARGELIALLDHDDLWVPHKLERQVPTFQNADVGLCYAAIRFFNINKVTGTKVVTSEYFPGENLDVHDLLAHTVLTIQTVMFPKRVIDEVGCFDEGLLGTDDWDMSIRIAARYKIVGIPETLAEARGHEQQQGLNSQRMYTNQMKVLEKHQNLHASCKLCRIALDKSRDFINEDFYARLKGHGRQAIKTGQYGQGLAHYIEAFRHNPKAIRRILLRVLLRALGKRR